MTSKIPLNPKMETTAKVTAGDMALPCCTNVVQRTALNGKVIKEYTAG